MNIVIIDGKVAKDPTIKSIEVGGKGTTNVANLNIIHTKGDKTHYIMCEGWGAVAKNFMRFSKGDDVTLGGELVVSSWKGDDGKQNSITKIRVNKLSGNIVHDVDESITSNSVASNSNDGVAVSNDDNDTEIPF